MKFGVFSLMQWPEDRTPGDVYRNELSQLVEAEAQGYDSIWLAEHHFSRYGIGPAIHLTAAHLAALTDRVRIGTAVTVLPFMHPIRIAEEVAMLDHLSGGRIDFGMGRGYQRHEFDGFGVDIEKSHLIFKEQLEIIEKAWEGKRFAWDGEFFHFDELEVMPTPVQKPRPPLYVAALSTSTLEWAADSGYPVLSDQFSPSYRLAKMRRIYLERAEKAGADPEALELPMLRQVYVGESMAEARERAGPALLWYYRSLAKVGSPGGISGKLPENYSTYNLFGEEGMNPDADPQGFLDFLFENCVIVGDASYCREKLVELRETCRLNSIITWQNFGGLPHEASRASQRRFIEDVAPAVA